MRRRYILIHKNFNNFISNKFLCWNFFFFLNLESTSGDLGGFLRVISDYKRKVLVCLFSFPELFHNGL